MRLETPRNHGSSRYGIAAGNPAKPRLLGTSLPLQAAVAIVEHGRVVENFLCGAAVDGEQPHRLADREAEMEKTHLEAQTVARPRVTGHRGIEWPANDPSRGAPPTEEFLGRRLIRSRGERVGYPLQGVHNRTAYAASGAACVPSLLRYPPATTGELQRTLPRRCLVGTVCDRLSPGLETQNCLLCSPLWYISIRLQPLTSAVTVIITRSFLT